VELDGDTVGDKVGELLDGDNVGAVVGVALVGEIVGEEVGVEVVGAEVGLHVTSASQQLRTQFAPTKGLQQKS